MSISFFSIPRSESETLSISLHLFVMAVAFLSWVICFLAGQEIPCKDEGV